MHPQFWPESLDYAGKRVVVIGSGATAISMIPSLTEKAGHVTMLQRSPTYMMSMPRINPLVQAIRKVLPLRAGNAAVRLYNTIFTVLIYAVRPQGAEVQQVATSAAPRKSSSARRLSASTSTSSRATTRGISGCA